MPNHYAVQPIQSDYAGQAQTSTMQPNGTYAFHPYTFQPALHPGASYINIPQYPPAGYSVSPHPSAGYAPQQHHEAQASMPQYGEYYCNPTPRLASPEAEELAARAAMPPPPPPTTPAARRRMLLPLHPKTLLRNIAGSKSSPNLHNQLHQEIYRGDLASEILEVQEITPPRRPSGSSGASGISGDTAVSRFSNVSADEPRPILSRSRSSIGLAKIRSRLFPARKKDGPSGPGY
jgi:hypothetical protein